MRCFPGHFWFLPSHPFSPILLFLPQADNMRDALSRLRPHSNVPVVEPEVDEKAASDKEANVVNTEGVKESVADDSDAISLDAQRGVQDIEALTKVWTKQDIILAYVT